MIFRRFPNSGKELRRPFEVSAHCHDCADFYDGCEAWPASKPFTCEEYKRLPDVMPGTCGGSFWRPHAIASAAHSEKPQGETAQLADTHTSCMSNDCWWRCRHQWTSTGTTGLSQAQGEP